MLFSFKKEKTVPKTIPASNSTAENEVTENLYKHNLELANKNKTLSLLRNLYQTSILTLEPEVLAQKVTEIVRETLDFDMVEIFIVDPKTNALLPIGLSKSTRLDDLSKKLGYPIKNSQILNPEEKSFFKPLFANHESHTENLNDVWGDTISIEKIEVYRKESHIKTTLAQPLFIGEKLTGVVLFGFNRTHKELSEFEKESISSLVGVTAIALDRSNLYLKLQDLNHELEQVNKQQIILIHFVTHQIKGFVAKSRNIFSMILDGDYGPLSDSMRPIVEEGYRSDTKGAQTIQEILNAANLKSGKVTYARESVDLREATKEIIRDLTPNAENKNLALTFTCSDEIPLITGDRMQLLNALKNLIDNSIKYTPSGSIAISLTQAGQVCRLVVTDTGIGITEEDMKNLFTEGGHGVQSQKVNVDSTGFGLYIVKNIIEAHSGKVWAESDGAGKGSTFTVELPVS